MRVRRFFPFNRADAHDLPLGRTGELDQQPPVASEPPHHEARHCHRQGEPGVRAVAIATDVPRPLADAEYGGYVRDAAGPGENRVDYPR